MENGNQTKRQVGMEKLKEMFSLLEIKSLVFSSYLCFKIRQELLHCVQDISSLVLPLPSLYPCFVLVYPGDKRVPAQSEFLPRGAGGAGDGKTCLEMELALRMGREDVMMDLF